MNGQAKSPAVGRRRLLKHVGVAAGMALSGSLLAEPIARGANERVRGRKKPNCPFEIGFRSAITCQMAVASYRQERAIHCDDKWEEIV